jgi:tetratricopeptide (TPR) repeat protein
MAVDAHIARAEMLLELRRPAEARVILEPVVASDPRDARALVMIAECLLAEDRKPAAFDMARRATGAAPGDVAVLVRSASVARRSGFPDAAATWGVKALALDPTSVGARNVLTLADLDRGEVASALYHAEIALGQWPDDLDLQVAYAMALDACGKPVPAARQYSRVLKAEPSHPYALNNLAAIRLQYGDVGTAGALWSRVLAADPRFVIAATNLDKAGVVFRQVVAARVSLIVSVAVLAGALHVPALYAVSAAVMAWTVWTSVRMPPAVRARLWVNLSRREMVRFALIAVGSVLAVAVTRTSGSAGTVTFYLLIYGMFITSLLLWRRSRLEVGLWLADRRRSEGMDGD